MTEKVVFCFIIVVLFSQPVFITGDGENQCRSANIKPGSAILPFCQNGAATDLSSTIYLDASGFPRGDIGECQCSVSSGTTLRGDITITAEQTPRPGGFVLEVDGKIIKSISQRPLTIVYKKDLPIVLKRTTNMSVTLCLKIEGELREVGVDEENDEPYFQIQCSKRRDIRDSPTERAGFDGKGDNNESNTGIIVGAIVGGLVIIITVAVVVIVVCRRRSKPPLSEDRRVDNHQREKADQTGQYQLTDNAGYVSADDVDRKAGYEEPGQTYDYIVHTDAVKEPAPSADQGVMGYASLSEYNEYSKPETTTPPKHDAEGYDVLNKYGKDPANKSANKKEENVYNRTDNPKVITPTGHIYGVGTPVNQVD